LPATATPTARHVTWISIGHAIAAATPARRITWIGIGSFQRTATTCNTAPIARVIIGVGIGFTAAALFGARLVFAR
jgi:hypothetical protein